MDDTQGQPQGNADDQGAPPPPPAGFDQGGPLTGAVDPEDDGEGEGALTGSVEPDAEAVHPEPVPFGTVHQDNVTVPGVQTTTHLLTEESSSHGGPAAEPSDDDVDDDPADDDPA